MAIVSIVLLTWALFINSFIYLKIKSHSVKNNVISYLLLTQLTWSVNEVIPISNNYNIRL